MATNTLPAKKRTGKVGSTIFLKTLMALSGVVFVLYVIAHMYGNLKLFAGEESFNTYSEHLRTFGEPILPRHGLLTIIEIVLVLCLVAHVYSAVVLARRAGAARPQKYAVKKRVAQTFSARWMRWGGLALLLFVIWHILNFTNPKINVGDQGNGPDIKHNPYALVVDSFQTWWLTLIYVAAMVALGMHLRHGIWSASQTLGWTSTTSARRTANTVAIAVALVVAVGFVLPPLFVLFGVID
ncbi:succinate dehydrogenase cytochrome b subunit [Luteipulveratus sp. YIM 133132]|uniref:Succinate dehydrogenase cytochrome b subunit n=1 Tax=Luteipulveratus flavus TaxID=3031728 RepID=A0ABT6C2Z3_9MICO|nr:MULTISPECIES: succinate dehydrogenase cytochrome b subunit [unclassified Luteipulveratus]MDE9367099.1 succinate dehydrogenase cytochrome b subunit [Luteipulveratus sp. YIM 133132]MDF8263085.1 succinate dehydrogenase cytochrome b subunit [Luteipulveratus sp. YIM 133296]